jgi:hypothetical protein
MFKGVVIDGSTSCIPGQFSAAASQEQEYEAGAMGGTDTDGFENSPMGSSSHKRGSTSTATSGESPSKKKNEPLLKTMFTGIIEKFDEDSKAANDNLAQFRSNKEALEEARKLKRKDQKEADVRRCLAMVKEYGADNKLDEFFVATTLFKDEYYRQIFCEIDTLEDRLVWL